MTKARTMTFQGHEWVHVGDLKAAMLDDDMIQRAAAMLKHAFKDRGDSANESLRMAIGYFYTEATGALSHLEN